MEQPNFMTVRNGKYYGCCYPWNSNTFNNSTPDTVINLALNQLLLNIAILFDENELAYLTIQGKNELQIRDKVAWHLQCLLDKLYPGAYIVRREWSPIKGRSKVDLAILELDKSKAKWQKVIALIEFKAQSFVNNEVWFYEEFAKDVLKLKYLSSKHNLNDTDLYFVFLQTCQDKNNYKPFSDAVSYKDLLDNKNTIICTSGINDNTAKTAISNCWDKFYNNPFVLQKANNGHAIKNDKLKNLKKIEINHSLTNPYNKHNNIPLQSIGQAYDYELYIAPMIWGPIKENNITPKLTQQQLQTIFQ